MEAGTAASTARPTIHTSMREGRVAEVAALFAQSGVIVITSFISPYHADRERARATAPELFHLVHINSSLEACEKRDVKGLYKKARDGKIPEFTGISAPYEAPVDPDLVLDTEAGVSESCVDELLRYIERQLIEPARDVAHNPTDI